MTKVRHSTNCGNSPKDRFAEEFVIALLAGDHAKIEQAGTADFRVEQVLAKRPREIVIDHVVTHGKAAAVSGTVTSEGGLTTGFCFMLTFATAKAERVAKVLRYSARDVSFNEAPV